MITWTVNWRWTHILSVLQETLQVSVVLELLWHLLGSPFILVVPEGQTQNGEKVLQNTTPDSIFLHFFIQRLFLWHNRMYRWAAEREHTEKIPDTVTQNSHLFSLLHREEWLSLKDQYPLWRAPVYQAELWELMGKAPMPSLLPLVDINDTVIRKLFHCWASWNSEEGWVRLNRSIFLHQMRAWTLFITMLKVMWKVKFQRSLKAVMSRY